MPARRLVVEFRYRALPVDQCRFWFIVAPGWSVDLCSIDPGFEIDLLVTADLRAMTSAWMGMSAFDEELLERRIQLDGDPLLSATFTSWVGQSGLAAGA